MHLSLTVVPNDKKKYCTIQVLHAKSYFAGSEIHNCIIKQGRIFTLESFSHIIIRQDYVYATSSGDFYILKQSRNQRTHFLPLATYRTPYGWEPLTLSVKNNQIKLLANYKIKVYSMNCKLLKEYSTCKYIRFLFLLFRIFVFYTGRLQTRFKITSVKRKTR